MGDLLATLPWLRPIAVTGNLGIDFPTKSASAGALNPNTFNYRFAFEYSLEHLQHQVRDVGLKAPFDRPPALRRLSHAVDHHHAVGPVRRERGGGTRLSRSRRAAGRCDARPRAADA